VKRIYFKIYEDLLELVWVAVYEKRLGAQLGYHRDAATRGFGFKQLNRSIRDCPDIGGDPHRLAAPAKIQQRPHHLGNTIDLVDDDLETLLQLALVRMVGQ
jgi:hypothetical protein